MYSIQKQDMSRYKVFAENGMLAGAILGSKGEWNAEADQRIVGSFETQEDAALAILQSKGIKGIFSQLTEIVESNPDLLVDNRHNFYMRDQAFVAGYKCATDVLWILHQHGTAIVPLDLPVSRREATEAVFQAKKYSADQAPKLFIINRSDLKVTVIAEADLRIRLARVPVFQFSGKKITRGRERIASVRITQPLGYKASDRKCEVSIECEEEPTPQIIAMLSRLGFAAPAEVPGKDVFFQPIKVEVVYRNKIAYLWNKV